LGIAIVTRRLRPGRRKRLNNELYELYETLYFHEIDMRAKLNARLQVPLTIIIALSGFLVSMLLNRPDCCAFWIIYLSATAFVLLSVWHFFRSFFNYDYHYQPTAWQTQDYYELLCRTYSGYDDEEKLVRRYMRQHLQDSYVRCATANSENNSLCSENLHRINRYLLLAAACALIAFVIAKSAA
jgi:hypothetical protein